jgi:zinc and cadmium transporter
MNTLLWILGATVIVSLISLVGVISLSLRHKFLAKILLILVGFSAGALMGGAFLHLLPESLEHYDSGMIFLLVLLGFATFFLVERILHWHHCHKEGKCSIHMFTYMSLIGDSVHNLIDGAVIAASFIISIPLGIATTIAVIAHEIPQELGDFGVLVYGGFSKTKALMWNLLTSLTAIVGALIGYFLSGYFNNMESVMIPFAAGGFVYIAGSDLIPELHKEPDLKKSLLSFGFFIIGILFMWAVKILLEH